MYGTFLLRPMQEPRTDTKQIIDAVKQKSLDHETFYNHVFDRTVQQYYTAILDEIACDLLTLPIERDCAGLESLQGDEALTELADTIIEIALILAGWFLKDPKKVELDVSDALVRAPAEDIRESRLLLRNNLLH